MAYEFETLHSIREWAKATFPDSFAKFEDLPMPKMTYQKYKARYHTYGIQIGDLVSPVVIEVGTLEDQGDRTVYAWDARRYVGLGHIVGFEGQMELYQYICSPRIVFSKPFCWVKPADDETGAARFAALVRYYYCVRIHARISSSSRVAAFKKDFQGACRDIAEQLTREASEQGTADGCVRPSNYLKVGAEQTQSPLTVQCVELSHEMHLTTHPAPATSSTSAPKPPNPASATVSASAVQSVDNHNHDAESTATPNTHLQALDQAFALFKASLNVQATAAEAAANHDRAELTSQIHSLERRIADAGEERERLEASLEGARGESEKWKVQYETLRKSVLATVERG